MLAEKEQVPYEWLGLNFTAIETTYTPYDEKHRAGTPFSVKANIDPKHSMASTLCHSI